MGKNKSAAGAAGWLFAAAVLFPMATMAQPNDMPPDGRGDHARQSPPKGESPGAIPGAAHGIAYHGGPVLANGVTTGSRVNVYYIWYGSWTQAQKDILTILASSIGGSAYFAINTTYNDSQGTVHNNVAYAGSTSYSSSLLGTKLTDADIFTLVEDAISSNALPTDPNGVYFVLTASGIAETSGFLTQYCGWHISSTYKSTPISYAFVGDPAPNGLNACSEQTKASPNGDLGVDAMASIIAHELDEATTDPQLNAWYDSQGNESADKCAWTFGTPSLLANGAEYNVSLGGLSFLIQQNWVNAGAGYCAMSYSGAPAPGALTLSATSSQKVTPGGTTPGYTVTATSKVGYPGTVTYSVTAGLPAGATPHVSGNVITIGTTSSTAPGTYTFTIEGASGNVVGATSATLVVQAAPLTISISPPSETVTIPSSGSVKAQYTVTVTGGAGAVTLTDSGATTGVTLSLSPASIPPGGGSATLTATVTSSAKKGSDALSVKAADGNTTKSASATLKVN